MLNHEELMEMSAPDIWGKIEDEYIRNNPMLSSLFASQLALKLKPGTMMPLMIIHLAEAYDETLRQLRTSAMLQMPKSPVVGMQAGIDALEELRAWIDEHNIPPSESAIHAQLVNMLFSRKQTLDAICKAANKD